MDAPRSPEVGEQLPVQVLLRLKPTAGTRETIVVHSGPRTLKVCNPVQSTSANGESILVSKRMEYTFDWVLPETASQQDTFRKSSSSMLRHFFSGGNALLFCYGPSGSGKSFTIMGDDKNPGIIPNILRSVFASIEAAKMQKDPSIKRTIDGNVFPMNPDMDYTVFINYLECYNEKVYDLLRKNSKEAPAPLDLKFNKAHVPIFSANEPIIENYQQGAQWLHAGQSNRQVGATQINKSSSRSHAIFTVRLTQTPIGVTREEIMADPSLVRLSKFTIVDLAGSERSGKSLATGDRLKEASNINNSLLTLKRCMKALQSNQMIANAPPATSSSSTHTSVTDSAQKRMSVQRLSTTGQALPLPNIEKGKTLEVVPFRDSTLTKLLREYFQGEGKCSVIVNINPTPADFDESLQALDFGTITKAVKTTTCKKKLVARSASPVQPIPFSLTQSAAAAKAERQGPGRTASKASMTLDRLNSSNLNRSLNQSTNLNASLNQSQNLLNSEALNRSTASVAKEVEASSPSKNILNRSRMPLSNVSSPAGASSRRVSEVSTLSFASAAVVQPPIVPAVNPMVARQLFRLDTDSETVSQFTSDEAMEEDDEEIMAFDELELVTEVNKLRTALADAENRVIEAEMAVRSELAQEVADRILETERYYRAQTDARLASMQGKYEKMINHLEQMHKDDSSARQEAETEVDADEESEDLHGSKMDAEDEEDKANTFDLLCEKEAQLEDARVQLTLTKAELSDASARLAAMHDSSHRELQSAQDAHREEVALLNMRVESLSKQLEEAKDALARAEAKLLQNAKNLAASPLPSPRVAKEIVSDEASDEQEKSLSTATTNTTDADDEKIVPAPKKKRGRPPKSATAAPIEEVAEETPSEEAAVPAEEEEPAPAKKKRGRPPKAASAKAASAKVVAASAETMKAWLSGASSKSSKRREDSTPSTTLSIDPFEFQPEFNDTTDAADAEEPSSKKKGVKKSGKRSSARATSRSKKTSIAEQSDDEKDEMIVDEENTEKDASIAEMDTSNIEEPSAADEPAVDEPIVEKPSKSKAKKTVTIEEVAAEEEESAMETDPATESVPASARMDEDDEDSTPKDEDSDAEANPDSDFEEDDEDEVKPRGKRAAARKVASPIAKPRAGAKRTLKRSVAVNKGRPTPKIAIDVSDDEAERDDVDEAIDEEPEVQEKPEVKRRLGSKKKNAFDSDSENDAENHENAENAPLPTRTPMTKRLRSRRPVEVLDSPIADETLERTAFNATGRPKRGTAAAPRYIGGMLKAKR